MDIQPYLERWQALESNRCKPDKDDFWFFYFDDDQPPIRCDIVSFHGVGVIEDLIARCIQHRPGWQHELLFDREEETFSARFIDHQGTVFQGTVSLNPGISLLSGYLKALEHPR